MSDPRHPLMHRLDNPWFKNRFDALLEVDMDIDREFFSIVEQLGPMGDIKLRSLDSHPAWVQRPANSCGCGNDSQGGCCKDSDDDGLGA